MKNISFTHFLYLAPPLELNSDNAFRTLCYRHGADVTFTEMIRLQGYVRNNAVTRKRLVICDDTPTIVQLLVNNEKDLQTFLASFKPFLGFRGFNMNMGCPSPAIIGIGQGAAAIKRTSKTRRLISLIQKAGYPISLKLRLGLNRYETEKKVYLNLIKDTSADFYIVHARDASQTYEDPADFSVYSSCVDTGKVIVANGDIATLAQIQQLQHFGVKGALIGRAAVHNPAIFNQLKGKSIPSFEELKKEYLELSKKYSSKAVYIENVSTRIGKNNTVRGEVQG